jgi:hypothetical protein
MAKLSIWLVVQGQITEYWELVGDVLLVEVVHHGCPVVDPPFVAFHQSALRTNILQPETTSLPKYSSTGGRMRVSDIDKSVKDLEHATKVLKHARTQPNVSKEDRRSQEARRQIVCTCMIRAFKRIMPIQMVSTVSEKV